MKKLLLLFFLTNFMAFAQFSRCDLNNDGNINVVDKQLAVNMALGIIPCTANINGLNVCNIITVQRIIKAAFGGTCDLSNGSEVGAPPTAHSVSLTWVASTSPEVVGYNVWRGAAAGEPYTKINSSLVAAVTYVDTTVSAGVTYYYVVTAVDAADNSSACSNEARAVIPSP